DDTSPVTLQFRAKKARGSVLHILVDSKKLNSNGKHMRSRSSGTGFIIKSNNKGSAILTAAHVVNVKCTKGDPQSKIYVRQMMPRGRVKQFEATIIHADYTADVAILEAKALKRAQALNFLSSDLVLNQSAIAVAHCNPHNLFKTAALTRLSVMSGQVMREKPFLYKNAGISTKAIAVDCPAMQGMSGGPVLGMTGVMGMISCGNSDRTIVVCNETIASVLDAYVHPETEFEPPLEELVLMMTLGRDDPSN
ncbi:hypothetical protein PVAP13_7KG149600, partial [Panicum virgatum]